MRIRTRSGLARSGEQGHLLDREVVIELDLAEFVAELDGAVRTCARFWRHRPFNQGAHIIRDALFAQIRNRLGRDPEKLCDHLFTAVAFEGGVAGDRTEQGGSETVDIGRHAGGLTAEYLGGSERRGSGDDPGG